MHIALFYPLGILFCLLFGVQKWYCVIIELSLLQKNTLLMAELLALMVYLYFYRRAISPFSLFMLNYFDLALRLIVLKDLFESASYFYMSLMVVWE